MRVSYIAFDGRIFNTAKECEEYEKDRAARFWVSKNYGNGDMTELDQISKLELKELFISGSYRITDADRDAEVCWFKDEESLKAIQEITGGFGSCEVGINFWNTYEWVSFKEIYNIYRTCLQQLEKFKICVEEMD